jgi:hypothetical protein
MTVSRFALRVFTPRGSLFGLERALARPLRRRLTSVFVDKVDDELLGGHHDRSQVPPVVGHGVVCALGAVEAPKPSLANDWHIACRGSVCGSGPMRAVSLVPSSACGTRQR